MRKTAAYPATAMALMLALMPATSSAYVGPGAGPGAIIGFLVLCLTILLAVIGLFWHPVKRILKGSSISGSTPEADPAGANKSKDDATGVS